MRVFLLWLTVLTVALATDTKGFIERDALGEVLTIGTFYDARNSLMMNGASFWSQAALKSSVISTDSYYSNIDVTTGNDVNINDYKLDVSAEIHVGIMSGEIQVDGAAKYLRDEKDDNTVARAVLTYHSTKKTDLLPLSTPKTFPEQCDMMSDDTGPTHVVSSIVYGLRAHFIFDKTVGKDDYTQDIYGSLKIKLNNLPNFKLDATADVNITDTDKSTLENTHITFYGDAIPSKMPGTYEQVKEVFDEINEAAIDGDKFTPVRYQLTPISYYCDDIEVALNKIREDFTSRAISIMSELTSMKTEVKTLLNREPALRFSSIRKQLVTFQAGLAEFASDVTEQIATIIPEIKSGIQDESEFSKLIAKYDESVWNKDQASIFLDDRTREINTIQLVLDKAHSSPSVVLSDRGAATDNQCIFSSKYATVYELQVLPSDDAAQQFAEGNYNAAEESSRWYNDLECVGEAGSQLIQFLEHAAATADDKHCSLIRLDTIAEEEDNDVLIKIYQHGEEVEGNFVFPGPPPAPVLTRALYTGLIFSAQASTDPKSHVTGIKVTATWKKALPPKDDDTERFEYFPTTFLVENSNSFDITGLDPHKEYDVKIAYVIPLVDDVGPASKEVPCKTAATSPPRLPQLYFYNYDYFGLTWQKPMMTADEDADVDYQVTLYKVELDKSECIDSEVDETGDFYRGTTSTTADGQECANWEYSDDSKSYRRADFPGQGLGPHNYCRNPDEEDKPWCFIEGSSSDWDLCDIPDCSAVELEQILTPARFEEVSGSTSTMFVELEIGQLYEVSIQAMQNGLQGDRVALLAATRPGAPNAPSLEEVTLNSLTVRVDLATMRMANNFDMDSLKVLYYKVSVSDDETVFGTVMTQTASLTDVDVSDDSTLSKEVRIGGLDSGSWYAVKSIVQLRLPNGNVIETEASQGIIVLTDSDPDSPASPLLDDINTFITSFNKLLAVKDSNLNTAKTTISGMNGIVAAYTSLTTGLTNYKNEVNPKVQAAEDVTRALMRQSCVKRGVKFSDYTAGSTASSQCYYTGIANEFDCLVKCKQSCDTNIEASRFVNKGSPDFGGCACLKERSGGIIELNGFFTSINRWCWDIFGGSPDQLADCTQTDNNLAGGTALYATTTVVGMVDCVRLCTEEKGCTAVAYNESQGKCWLKGSTTTNRAQNGYSSIQMNCLMS